MRGEGRSSKAINREVEEAYGILSPGSGISGGKGYVCEGAGDSRCELVVST